MKKTVQGRKELEKELANVKRSMQQMRQEQEEQQRRQDAPTQQRTNIQNAFSAMNAYSQPLETEKKRLNWLFYIYGLLCIVTLVLLTIYECRFLKHFNTLPDTEWTNYLPFYLPIPLCGGLLWAFIHQINRAQRQLYTHGHLPATHEEFRTLRTLRTLVNRLESHFQAED